MNTGENEELKLADHRVYLTKNGVKQAEKSAKALQQYIKQNDIKWKRARVWFSPYDRTRQTMEVYDSVIDFKKNKMYVEEDICLTEQQFGLFDSIPKEQWEELYPKEYEAYNKFRSQGDKFWARLHMGESPFDMAVRTKVFLGMKMKTIQKIVGFVVLKTKRI